LDVDDHLQFLLLLDRQVGVACVEKLAEILDEAGFE
jgi:hypothetical protein